MKKCLESAIANAENNHNLDVDDLVVSQAFVGKALVMKRFHARARGRAPAHEAVLEPHHRGSGRRTGVKENQMGQKVNPIGLRLGINRTWDSALVRRQGRVRQADAEDMAIRDALMKQLKQAAVSKIVIERPHKKCRRHHPLGRPGVVIGKKGADIEKLRKLVAKMTDAE